MAALCAPCSAGQLGPGGMERGRKRKRRKKRRRAACRRHALPKVCKWNASTCLAFWKSNDLDGVCLYIGGVHDHHTCSCPAFLTGCWCLSLRTIDWNKMTASTGRGSLKHDDVPWRLPVVHSRRIVVKSQYIIKTSADCSATYHRTCHLLLGSYSPCCRCCHGLLELLSPTQILSIQPCPPSNYNTLGLEVCGAPYRFISKLWKRFEARKGISSKL